MIFKVKYQLLLLALVAPMLLFAQKANLTAKVDKTTVSTSDYIVLQVTAQGGEIKSYSPPAFENFKILQNYRNSGSNISIVNGKMTSSTTYTWVYYLQPNSAGTHTIEVASANIDGNAMTTKEISITASQGSSTQANTGTNNSSNNNQGNSNQVNVPAPTNTTEEIFIKAYADKTSVYVGEQVNVTYKLYTRVPIYEYGVSSDASFNGFLKNEVNLGQPKTQQETINGQRYNTAIIKQTILFAQFSGTYESTPLEVDMIVEVRKPWGNFGYYSDYEKTSIKSTSLSFEIQALPEAGKPGNFSGAVGEYQIDVDMPEGILETDEEFTLRTTISGKGNIHLFEPPEIELPRDFEVYAPEMTENLSKNFSGYSGSKVYEYLVVPRQPGTYDVPAISFSYFNPKEESYVEVKSDPFEIIVEGEPSTVATSSSSSGANIDVIDEDIRFIHSYKTLKTERKFLFGSKLGYALYSTPLFALLILFAVRRRRDSAIKDVVGTKQRKASRLARKRLATARKFLKAKDDKGFYDEVSRAVQGYVSDKLNIPLSQLNNDSVAMAVTEREAPEALSLDYAELLDRCQMALFGAGSSTASMEEEFNNAARFIDDMEKNIR